MRELAVGDMGLPRRPKASVPKGRCGAQAARRAEPRSARPRRCPFRPTTPKANRVWKTPRDFGERAKPLMPQIFTRDFGPPHGSTRESLLVLTTPWCGSWSLSKA